MTIQSYRRARIGQTPAPAPAPARAPRVPPTRRLQGSKDYESITQLNFNIHKEEIKKLVLLTGESGDLDLDRDLQKPQKQF